MEPIERVLLDRYKTALGSFLACPEDAQLHSAYDAAMAALGVRYREPGIAEFSIECIAAFELALEGYERTLIALNHRTIELIESNKSLRASNDNLDSFASTAAHDLRVPLRKIIGFGAILKQRTGVGLPLPAAEVLDRIQTTTARMNNLLDSLLAYARTASSGSISHDRFNLRLPAEEAVSDLELFVQQSEASIELGHLDDVSGDQVQIRQLFQNLISNALKFFRPAVKPKVIIASLRAADGRVELSIRDNGIGFDEKYLERILKPFQRLNPVDEFEGSGLGLAVCARIAARHGAVISARSSEGNGAEFIITFPSLVRHS